MKKSQDKNESPNVVKPESILSTSSGAYMLLPNQKYVKILVGPQNQTANNTFQNVFLNLIPATTLTPVASASNPSINTTAKTKDTNQNVFLNLNNTFQKFIPVASSVKPTGSTTITPAIEVTKKVVPAPIKSPPPLSIPAHNLNNVNVNQLLNESKSEEVSVEIDPTVFGLEGEDEADSNDEEEINDYDEVISSAKITLKDFKPNGEKVQNGKEDSNKFVPILPKQQDDFFTSGQHFLFGSSGINSEFVCETCQKPFASKRLLKVHFNQFHLGKLPFKCEFCYLEYVTRTEYENCRKNHHSDSDALHKSITLEDFANSSNSDLSLLEEEAAVANLIPSENGEYFCDVCRRPFNSSTGLLRHKVRKHNQKNRKKYFIKGMKNARCDICNREFSTQSYMQLHRKLHLRDDIGYKYKVFGKSKYGDIEHLIKDEKDGEKTDKTEKAFKKKEKTDAKLQEEKEADNSRSPEHDDTSKEEADTNLTSECDLLEPEIKMEVDEHSDNDDEESNLDEQENEKNDDDNDNNSEKN